MEDYTYHFDPSGMRVLGAHMLEVCPSIALGTPTVEYINYQLGEKRSARLVLKLLQESCKASVVDLKQVR